MLPLTCEPSVIPTVQWYADSFERPGEVSPGGGAASNTIGVLLSQSLSLSVIILSRLLSTVLGFREERA